MKALLCLGAALVVFGGVAGCGGGDSGAQAGAELAGDWRSTSVEQAAPPPAPQVAAKQVKLLLLPSGRMVASARCNALSGTYRVDGGRLVVGEAAITELGCADPERHHEDVWLTAFLAARPKLAQTSDGLDLRTDATRIRLSPRALVSPDRSLENTRWKLTSVTFPPTTATGAPDASVGTAPPLSQTELTFADGTVRGSTGCASFSGPAQVSGGEVVVGELTVARSNCVAGVDNDLEVVAVVLNGKVSARIVESSLTLVGPSRHGLTFEADAATPSPTP
ncbi:MAG: META domain-containing protein [Sporichthyaceae bacterium]